MAIRGGKTGETLATFATYGLVRGGVQNVPAPSPTL